MKLSKQFPQFVKNNPYLCSLILIFIILTPIFLTPVIYGYDGSGYYSYVHSVVIDGDIDLSNQMELYKEKYDFIDIRVSDETGRVNNQYTIGTALHWAPFFIVAHGLTWATGGELDGYTGLYPLFTTFGTAVYVLLGLILLFKLASEFVMKKYAFVGVMVFWLSSHLFYYTYLQPSMSHGISFFTVTLFFYWWYKRVRIKSTNSRWVILGIIAALSTLVRVQNIVFLILPLIYYISDIIKAPKKFFEITKGPLLAALVATIIWIPQFLTWNYLFGSLLPVSDNYGNGIQFNAFNMLNVLFSNKHGLFNWTPVFLLGAVGLYFLIKDKKNDFRLSLGIILVIIAQLVITASWQAWWSGFAFGNRYMLDTAVFFTIGFVYFLKKVSFKRKWVIPLIAILLISWNFNLIYQYGTRVICGDCAASPFEIIRNSIRLLPNMLKTVVSFISNKSGFLG